MKTYLFTLAVIAFVLTACQTSHPRTHGTGFSKPDIIHIKQDGGTTYMVISYYGSFLVVKTDQSVSSSDILIDLYGTAGSGMAAIWQFGANITLPVEVYSYHYKNQHSARIQMNHLASIRW